MQQALRRIGAAGEPLEALARGARAHAPAREERRGGPVPARPARVPGGGAGARLGAARGAARGVLRGAPRRRARALPDRARDAARASRSRCASTSASCASRRATTTTQRRLALRDRGRARGAAARAPRLLREPGAPLHAAGAARRARRRACAPRSRPRSTNPFAYVPLAPAAERAWLERAAARGARACSTSCCTGAPRCPSSARRSATSRSPALRRAAQTAARERAAPRWRWAHESFALRARRHRGARRARASSPSNARGVCQDFAHLLVALVRGWGFAARYVMGYVDPGAIGDDAPDSERDARLGRGADPGRRLARLRRDRRSRRQRPLRAGRGRAATRATPRRCAAPSRATRAAPRHRSRCACCAAAEEQAAQ